MTTNDEERRLESLLRSRARTRGLRLVKSHSRTPEAYEYGLFMIVDADTNMAVAGAWPSAFTMSLEDVAAYFSDE